MSKMKYGTYVLHYTPLAALKQVQTLWLRELFETTYIVPLSHNMHAVQDYYTTCIIKNYKP